MTLDSVAGVGRSKAHVLGKQDEAWFLSLMSELAALPLGARQLRQAVLNLAIRGRLAPQRSADEPVDALLRRVGEKRSFLVAKKYATSCESLAPVTDEEEPYSVPAGWSWVRLGLTSICRDAQRVPVSKEQRLGRKGRFAYYGASGAIDTIDDYIFDGPLLLVGEDGANLVNRSTPIAFIADGQYWVNNHAHVLDVADIDHLRYLALFINATDLVPYVTGTAQPKMNQAKMNMIPVALPPLAEQQRIVAKVDQLMALCDDLETRQTKKRDLATQSTRSALTALTTAETAADLAAAWKRVDSNLGVVLATTADVEACRQSLVDMAVGGLLLYEADRSWPVTPLGEVVASTRYGTSKKCDHNPRLTPVLRIPNVVRGALDLGDLKHAQFTVDELAELALRSGDLLIVRSNGSKDLVAQGSVVDSRAEGFAYAGYLVRVRLHQDRVRPEWVRLALRSTAVRQQVESPIRTTSGVHNINTKELLALQFPLPARDAQDEALAVLGRLFRLLDDLEAKLRKQEQTATRLAESLAAAVAA